MFQWTNQNVKLLQHKAVCSTIMSLLGDTIGSTTEEAINYGRESWKKLPITGILEEE